MIIKPNMTTNATTRLLFSRPSLVRSFVHPRDWKKLWKPWETCSSRTIVATQDPSDQAQLIRDYLDQAAELPRQVVPEVTTALDRELGLVEQEPALEPSEVDPVIPITSGLSDRH